MQKTYSPVIIAESKPQGKKYGKFGHPYRSQTRTRKPTIVVATGGDKLKRKNRTMKHLLQFFAIAAALFVLSFGLNYLIAQADPKMDFHVVREQITYGCTMFSVIIAGMAVIYEPPKAKRR